ncbi:MAG: gamma-glutamyltransferase [Pseudomonadota bacterium]
MRCASATLLLLLGGCAAVSEAPESSQIPKATGAPPSAVLRYDAIVHPVVGTGGMVVSQNAAASEVGRAILVAGGNAIDASVAMGFALAVTLPRAGNIGGSGFSLLYQPGQPVVALDFRSAAPAAFDPDNYRDAAGGVDTGRLKFGAQGAGVPGTVAGLFEAWRRGGSLPWPDLLAPAIRLAADGIVVTHDLATALAAEAQVFGGIASSRAVFFDPATDQTYRVGSVWKQPALAASLSAIAREGAATFYSGALARRLVAAVQADGGHIAMADLRDYRVRERQPLAVAYRDRRVVAMPPVSGGGVTLLQMLNVLQCFDLARYPQGSAASVHLLAEVMKFGAANRRFGIGDPDFVSVPVAESLSARVADRLAARIDLQRAARVSDIRPLHAGASTGPGAGNAKESRDTTHYSVVDRWGNAVSTTYTLGYSFGGGYIAGDTGILLDNQMRNFSYADPGHANAHRPGKRMMSTMTPTLVFDAAGDLELVTGSPGGGRIINVILQLLVNVIDYDLNVAEATHAPRVHQPWRSQPLTVEPGVGVDTVELLDERGHEVQRQASMGSTQTIRVRDGLFFGAADPRRPGALALPVAIGDVGPAASARSAD